MSEPIVYLAGPISGLSYGECTDWRSDVEEILRKNGIRAVSPMRAKNYLENEKKIGGSYEGTTLSSRKGITTRDRFDVMRADLILVNIIGAERVSIGTVMEIAWADMLRKPVVLAMEEDNLHEHPMLVECSGFICRTLEEATKITVAVLRTGV